jgi:hypothetical protein
VIEAEDPAKADEHTGLLGRLSDRGRHEVLAGLHLAGGQIERAVAFLDHEIATVVRDDDENDETA